MNRDLGLGLVMLLLAAIGGAGCGGNPPAAKPPQKKSAEGDQNKEQDPGAKQTPKGAETGGLPTAEAVARHNHAVGLVGQYEFERAFTELDQLVQEHPKWLAARINREIAYFNWKTDAESTAQAAGRFEAMVREAPDNLRARYCLGVLLHHIGKGNEAEPHFLKVHEADPRDAYCAYKLAECRFEAQDFEQALKYCELAVKLDPQLRSAYNKAFQSLQRLKRPAEARAQIEQFQRLAGNPQAGLVEIKYGHSGGKSMVEAVDGTPSEAKLPAGPVFGAAAAIAEGKEGWSKPLPGASRGASITACDIDGDGQSDLFIAGGEGDAVGAVLLRRGQGFELNREHPLAKIAGATAVLWGDFDNDGLVDGYFCRRGGNQLWRQSGKGQWEDVTEKTRTAGGPGCTIDGMWIDADHDGDLDLFLVRDDGPIELLNNNGEGTFSPLAAEKKLASSDPHGRGLVAADLDGDRDLDLVVIHAQPPHDVLLNDRTWNYHPGGKAYEKLTSAAIEAAVAADADADGQVEIYTLHAGTVSVFAPDQGGVWQGRGLFKLGAGGGEAPFLAVGDFTGDGKTSVLAGYSAGGELHSISAAEKPLAVLPGPLAGAAVVVLDPARGPSLATVGDASSPPQLFPPGEGRLPFFAIQPRGRHDVNAQIRSAASGFGVTGAVRIGSHWASISTLRTSSGPGQSDQPLALGTRGAEKIDFVKLAWPDGCKQVELGLAAGKLHRIAETQRQTSSCPVIFVWNGERYEFVTDCLGVGGLGFFVSPGQYAPVRPRENVLLPQGLMKVRDGRYLMHLSEPMEEALYLDGASLAAWDLPPQWRMTLDERMEVQGPPASGEPVFFRRSLAPERAVNDRQEDVTEAVRTADNRAAPLPGVDRRFLGRLQTDHVLTLSFPAPLDGKADDTAAASKETAAVRPVLWARGWIEYPYSQTNFAAWQAHAEYLAPTIEARAPGGEWKTVHAQFGYPAGMPREMSVPLAGLPAGCRELRITTNMEIYWDALAVIFAEDCPQARRVELPLVAARAERIGFPLRVERPQKRPDYDFSQRDPFWRAAHAPGFYTAWGDVLPLVREVDDAAAIIGPGESIALAFDAKGAPSLPAGWSRQMVLSVSGWCKDWDLYTQDGQTLGPLPVRGPLSPSQQAARDALHERYQTRFESGER